MQSIRSYKELRVYQAAMDAAMRIFELTKRFPIDIAEKVASELDQEYHRIIGQLVRMIDEPEPWLIRSRKRSNRQSERASTF